MGCEMAAVVGSATAHGSVYFGQNIHHPPPYQFLLHFDRGQTYADGEMLELTNTAIPQTNETYSVLGYRSEPIWGCPFGLNEKGLAVGCATWESKIGGADGGLTGAELVRLTLERADHVERGLDVLTDLLSRFGQSSGFNSLGHVFVVADSQCAYVLEAAGPFWAASEIRHVRAACNLALIRQDWQLVAPGVVDFAVEQGWWMPDGAKLDFSGALQQNSPEVSRALKTWSRATFLLEQHNGHIDAATMRRILSDHFDGTPSEFDPMHPPVDRPSVCRHDAGAESDQTAASVLVELPNDTNQLPVLWCCVGPPCVGVYIPFFPFVPPPSLWNVLAGRVFVVLEKLGKSADAWMFLRNRMEAMQTRIQAETDEFLSETNRADTSDLTRQCELFMQNTLEKLEVELELLEKELKNAEVARK